MEQNTRTPIETTSCGAITWRMSGSRLEILLIRQFRSSESMGIPKGHLKEGETLEQCALREVKEETGLTVILEDRLTPIRNLIKKKEFKTVIAFLAQPVGDDKPNIDDPDCEVVGCDWFNVDELPQIHAYQRSLVEEAIRVLKSRLIGRALAEALTFVHGYAGNVDEWGIVKRELLKVLPATARGSFSLRHPITKKHQTNDFERELAVRWSKLTGRPVLFTNEHHDPTPAT